MGWLNRATTVVQTTEAVTAQVRELSQFPLVVPTWAEFAAFQGLAAQTVPAYTRGLRLISGTVAQLPLMGPAWLAQPEPALPYWATMQRLVEDLVQHAAGYWLIGDVAGGQISYVTGLPAADCTVDRGVVRMGDKEYPVSNPTGKPTPGRVIVFTGYRDGTLTLGTPAMTTAVALDALARHYAEQPNPTQALQNTSNYELSDTEITELLDGWKAARREGTAAYLNAGVDLKESGFSAEQLQLEALTNMSALQAARLLNLDPMWVGASVSGSSLTYTNRVDARQDLIDLTLTDYTSPIAQRLSMPDAAGVPVDFSTAAFLRANLSERSRMAIDLFQAGIITLAEARAFVSETDPGNPT